MRGVWGEVRVGALSLTGTRVTLMVVLWGGWLEGRGVERGGRRGKERVYVSVIYLVSYPLSTLPFSSLKGGLCSRL